MPKKKITQLWNSLGVALFSFGLLSCAQLHHVQYGEIESYPGYVYKPFDIKLSETGVSLEEGASLASRLSRNTSDSDAIKSLAVIVSLFQMGPRTGNPVYEKGYAKNLIQILYEKCPSGRVTGLTSIRESRKYPVVSGEIVKVTGYCLLRKEP